MPILRYCHFGVSPVNYSDSDSSKVALHTIFAYDKQLVFKITQIMTVQERIFHLSVNKQSLEKHLSCVVKYLVVQVGHGISTCLSNIDQPEISVSGKLTH